MQVHLTGLSGQHLLRRADCCHSLLHKHKSPRKYFFSKPLASELSFLFWFWILACGRDGFLRTLGDVSPHTLRSGLERPALTLRAAGILNTPQPGYLSFVGVYPV